MSVQICSDWKRAPHSLGTQTAVPMIAARREVSCPCVKLVHDTTKVSRKADTTSIASKQIPMVIHKRVAQVDTLRLMKVFHESRSLRHIRLRVVLLSYHRLHLMICDQNSVRARTVHRTALQRFSGVSTGVKSTRCGSAPRGLFANRMAYT